MHRSFSDTNRSFEILNISSAERVVREMGSSNGTGMESGTEMVVPSENLHNVGPFQRMVTEDSTINVLEALQLADCHGYGDAFYDLLLDGECLDVF